MPKNAVHTLPFVQLCVIFLFDEVYFLALFLLSGKGYLHQTHLTIHWQISIIKI
jgi:hypothetical protein